MRRFIGTVAGVAAVGLGTAGIASAATPQASTGAAVKVTTSSVVLRAHVDPEGEATAYAFNYGPTTSYGASSAPRSAGSGVRPVFVRQLITGLQPGTTYHFQAVATNASGSATGADGAFRTKGTPPSQVFTGPPTAVGKTTATVSGAVDPVGAPTSWVVQYGTTTAYGQQTFSQPLAAAPSAVPVSLGLTGLAPATLFHYRIAAFHSDGTVTYGADASFFTEPDNPPSADMSTRTSPHQDKHSPYTFTTTGTLHGGSYIPAPQRCTGTVGVRYFNGSHQLAYVVAPVSPTCTFSAHASFKKTDGHGAVRLRVSVFYRGSGYLAKASKIDHPVVGKKPTHEQ
jgi:hypothetical protein